jgi:hypothetical protein
MVDRGVGRLVERQWANIKFDTVYGTLSRKLGKYMYVYNITGFYLQPELIKYGESFK